MGESPTEQMSSTPMPIPKNHLLETQVPKNQFDKDPSLNFFDSELIHCTFHDSQACDDPYCNVPCDDEDDDFPYDDNVQQGVSQAHIVEQGDDVQHQIPLVNNMHDDSPHSITPGLMNMFEYCFMAIGTSI